MRKRLFTVLGFYSLLAFLVLYNPIFHITTSLPSDPRLSIVTDFYHFHWNFWWIRHALTTPGLHVYQTNYVMAPFTSNLAYHTLSVFWYPIWALLEPIFGTVVGMTAILIAALVLAGGCFYIFLRDEGVSPGLALIGGAMLELCPLMLSSIRWTNINLMGWFWIPLLLLTWKQIVHTGLRRRAMLLWAALLGISLWAMVLTDLQYPLFAFFIVVPYGLMTVWRAPSWLTRRWLIIAVALAALLALLLLWFVGPLSDILSFDRYDLAPTPADRAPKIEFPLCFVWHCDESVPVGAVVLPVLVVAGAINVKKRVRWNDSRWFWLALVPVPLSLSAGAAITIGGRQITMPYVLLHQLFGGEFRYAERFGTVFLIPAVIFIMITLTDVFRRRATSTRIFVLATLFFVIVVDAHMLEPTPLQPIPYPYTFYQAMGKESYDYVVVEVPTGGASGEGLVGDSHNLITQFYGITHGKRMVNGHISRVPISHYWYMRTDDAMMAWLGQRRFIEPDVVTQQMQQRIFDWPIGYFVIHRDSIGVGSVTDQEVLGYFNSLRDLVCPVWIEGDAIVYRTVWHPDGCPARIPPQDATGSYLIDVGAPDDLHYIGWGWHQAETISGLTLRWTGEYPQTQMYFDLPAGGYQLTISAQAFYESRRLRVLINGEQVGDPVMVTVDALHPYTFPIPADVIGDGQDLDLTLDYDATVVPALVGQGNDARKLAVAVDTMSFAPEK
jgi:hypothetical protein